MESNTLNNFKEQFRTLPAALKKLITDDSLPIRINGIGRKYALNEEQAEGLLQETLFVLIGMEPVSSFRANLVQELDITYDQALKIAYDTNAQIFGPIMDMLKEMDAGIKNNEQGEQKTETPGAIHNDAILQVSKPQPPRIGVETHPDHMIPDHEEMERTEGVHLHSQTVMPSNIPIRTPASANNTQKFVPQSKPSMGSIVDQKLKNIVRSPITTPTNLPTDEKDLERIVGERPDPYKGNDPYRESIN